MLNFNFSEKDLGLGLHHIAGMIFQETCHNNLPTGHISWSDYLYFSKYWPVYGLQLFVNQAVMS